MYHKSVKVLPKPVYYYYYNIIQLNPACTLYIIPSIIITV